MCIIKADESFFLGGLPKGIPLDERWKVRDQGTIIIFSYSPILMKGYSELTMCSFFLSRLGLAQNRTK